MSDKATQESFEDILQLFKETGTRFKETEALINDVAAESKRAVARIAATEAQIAATGAHLRQVEGLFTSQWGKMIEALIEPAALSLFRAHGFAVTEKSRRIEKQLNGRMMELDLVLEDDQNAIIVEAKSTLKRADVDEFLADLGEVTHFFSRYRGKKIYGAVAGLIIDQGVDRYAYRRGLFVLSISDGVVSIHNDERFRPRNFG